MRRAPVELGEAEIEVAQGYPDGHVSQREVDAGAIGFFGQCLAHGFQGGFDFTHLTLDPGVAALRLGAPGPMRLQPRRNGSVHHAVGQCFPGLDFGPFSPDRRNEFAHGREGVEVLHNHP